MKLITPLLAIALGTLTLQESQALSITNFQPDSYSVDDPADLQYSIDPDGLRVTGFGLGETINVQFEPVELSGMTEFTLTGTLHSENYGTAFTLTLVGMLGGEVQTRDYTGLFDYGTGRATVFLTPAFEDTALTNVFGFTFFSGFGEPLDYTFESIEAVPEPSVYALSFLAAGGAYLLRRRRAMKNR